MAPLQLLSCGVSPRALPLHFRICAIRGVIFPPKSITSSRTPSSKKVPAPIPSSFWPLFTSPQMSVNALGNCSGYNSTRHDCCPSYLPSIRPDSALNHPALDFIVLLFHLVHLVSSYGIAGFSGHGSGFLQLSLVVSRTQLGIHSHPLIRAVYKRSQLGCQLRVCVNERINQ